MEDSDNGTASVNVSKRIEEDVDCELMLARRLAGGGAGGSGRSSMVARVVFFEGAIVPSEHSTQASPGDLEVCGAKQPRGRHFVLARSFAKCQLLTMMIGWLLFCAILANIQAFSVEPTTTSRREWFHTTSSATLAALVALPPPLTASASGGATAGRYT